MNDAATKSVSARKEALDSLARLVVEKMTPNELDLAAGLLLGMAVQEVNGKFEFIGADGAAKAFTPTRSWEDYGRVVGGFEVVVSTHEHCGDKGDPDKVTAHYHRAHSFFGQTESEGFDLRTTVMQTAAKRLQHEVKYPRDEGRERIG